LLAVAALAPALGCQDPFGADRHDLAGSRLAAVAVHTEGGALRPRALVVDQGRLWADDATVLRWFWDREVSDIAADEVADAEGPDAVLGVPTSHRQLALVASTPGGAVLRATLDVSGEVVAPELGSIGLSVLSLDVEEVDAEQLELEDRVGLEATPSTHVPVGGFARLSLSAPDVRIRWMATGGGTFFELEPGVTDWAAGDLLVDDDEITHRSVLPPGVHSFVALGVDDEGGNAWRVEDVFVGQAPQGLWTPAGRFLATNIGYPGPGLVRGILVADDTAPAGLRLDAAEPVELIDLSTDDPYKTEQLACVVAVSGPFDPDWLATQRCLRHQVVGQTVVLEAR
jgi:hypothetical protein